MSAGVGRSAIAVIAIGRNEGERLLRCLDSIPAAASARLYVDSGSSDGSAERARQRGFAVVELDPALPMSAARARNAGFEALGSAASAPDFVQFVDGDCELELGWLGAAAGYLAEHPDVAVVCGRRRERFPDASVYNLLADMEWDAPPGDTDACGGDAMIRARSFREVGGFDMRLIAGEEPELCQRIRRTGARIVRLDRAMTIHDAALLRFGQWWRRQVRAGHAYAAAVLLHRGDPDPHKLRRLLAALAIGAALPGLCVSAAWTASGWILLGVPLVISIPLARAWRSARLRWPPRASAIFASACLAAKFAECEGALRFAIDRWWRGRETPLIEYKGPDR